MSVISKALRYGVIHFIAALVICGSASVRADNLYTESFSTRRFCDALATTANWDTVSGEVKLHRFELDLAGDYGTGCSAIHVVVEGNYAYMANSSYGLRVIDIADPENPLFAGNVDTPGTAYCVAISGDYAYIADYSGGLQVVDITDPHYPVIVAEVDTMTDANGVVIAGDYAFVTDYIMGLVVIDISDPENPFYVNNTGPGCFCIGISGDRAFVGASSTLRVLDISDPANPVYLNYCATPNVIRDMIVSGDHVYIADSNSGLRVVDISDPDNPFVVAGLDTPGEARRLAISGDYVYIADDGPGIHVVDISDPAAPEMINSFDTPGSNARGIALAGEYAFVADGYHCLHVVDIADFTSPSIVGSIATPSAQDVTVAGDYAYVADHEAGLKIIDIGNPWEPELEGYYDSLGTVYDVAVSGDYAYLANGLSGLLVVDISDPAGPKRAGSYDTPGNAQGVAVSGDYAYVADGSAGILVVDISDPAAPSYADLLGTSYNSRNIAISGDRAYVADGTGGLWVVGIADPADIQDVDRTTFSSEAKGIALSGDHAFIASSNQGLRVFDISDPDNPFHVASVPVLNAEDVDISGDYLYLAGNYEGLHVFDISDVSNPVNIGTCDTPGLVFGAAFSGDHVFTADWNSGLQVVEVFRRSFDEARDIAQSVAFDGGDDVIRWARLESDQLDGVTWELSADGGGNWEEVLPGADWVRLDHPGTDLLWRSTHSHVDYHVNPSCTSLELEWLNDYVLIDAIADVPNDQGGQVRIEWMRSALDYRGSTTPITGYSIYRRIDRELTLPGTAGNAGDPDPATKVDERPRPLYPPGDWDFVTTVPARQEDIYSVIVSTLADSTITEGMYYSTFFISALTETIWVYYDSAPDSGYSVDNLSPQVPFGFAVAYNTGGGNELAWEESSDADFMYFRIYRSESGEFVASAENYIHGVTGAGWTDPVEEGYRYFYKVSTVDFSGNESEAVSPASITGEDLPPAPKTFALYQNAPNPFNPATTIGFDLPRTANVSLTVYNIKGELVAILEDGQMTAGRKEVYWDGKNDRGEAVASGVYFYRLVAGDFVQTRKIVLLR